MLFNSNPVLAEYLTPFLWFNSTADITLTYTYSMSYTNKVLVLNPRGTTYSTWHKEGQPVAANLLLTQQFPQIRINKVWGWVGTIWLRVDVPSSFERWFLRVHRCLSLLYLSVSFGNSTFIFNLKKIWFFIEDIMLSSDLWSDNGRDSAAVLWTSADSLKWNFWCLSYW